MKICESEIDNWKKLYGIKKNQLKNCWVGVYVGIEEGVRICSKKEWT